jgi:glycosyltransferase involved in cell wall biosynthesis
MSESSERGTVLFVSPGPELMTPASGEGTRLKHLSRQLADEWDILALVPEAAATETPPWVRQQYTYVQWSLPFLTDLNPSFIRALVKILRREDVDVVHLSHGVCTARVLSLVLRSNTLVNYASQNVETEHATDFVNPDLPVYKRFLGPRLIPAIERATVWCADAVTTVSEKDRETFIERYDVDSDRIRAIPTGTEMIDENELEDRAAVREQYGLDDGTVAVFHGFYDHAPNRKAAELIDEAIAPALRRRGVDVEFLLVGKGAPAVSSSNVHAAGFVEDLYSVLGAADFAVVPIRYGGGTKTKMYDYISLGLPMVATEKALEGIDLEDRRHALITDGDVGAFVDAVERLAANRDLAAEMAENLEQLAADWSWERSTSRLSVFYGER